MLFSRGTPLWADLSAFFVDIDLLLLYLKSWGFTGYVKVMSELENYLILIDEGDVVAGAQKDVASGRSFGKPVNDIIAFARDNKEIKLTVSRLLSGTVDVFSNLYSENCKLVRKDLYSDFAKIGKLFAKLQQDRFNGYVLVDFLNEDKQGIIMLNSGRISAVASDKLQLNRDDSELLKIKSATVLIAEAQKSQAVFNVYKVPAGL